MQKFGAIPFRNAGYILPNCPAHQERFEWLGTAIRGYGGDASVLQILAIDEASPSLQQEVFRQARSADYSALIGEIAKLKPSASGTSGQIFRLKRRYEEIVAIDFFGSPVRLEAEDALARAERPLVPAEKAVKGSAARSDFQHRTWMTRPRPGIDRVSSAWLISHFIDPSAEFIFGIDPETHASAVAFDMYHGGGFGHESNRCTFETLCLAFDVSDKKVLHIAEAIHDADLEDGRYGRLEGHTINQILKGWAAQGVSDDELLRRGMDLTEGLYHSIP